ncbi:MAG: hypothetical protein ABEJ98_01915 [Candidatus Nanohaloarchaea archaeon]
MTDYEPQKVEPLFTSLNTGEFRGPVSKYKLDSIESNNQSMAEA